MLTPFISKQGKHGGQKPLGKPKDVASCPTYCLCDQQSHAGAWGLGRICSLQKLPGYTVVSNQQDLLFIALSYSILLGNLRCGEDVLRYQRCLRHLPTRPGRREWQSCSLIFFCLWKFPLLGISQLWLLPSWLSGGRELFVFSFSRFLLVVINGCKRAHLNKCVIVLEAERLFFFSSNHSCRQQGFRVQTELSGRPVLIWQSFKCCPCFLILNFLKQISDYDWGKRRTGVWLPQMLSCRISRS